MTKEEIEGLEAGREMDALIAEKVMGYRWLYWTVAYGEERVRGLFPSEYHNPFDYEPWTSEVGNLRITKMSTGIMDYSTEIAAAWQIVEKMREQWSVENPDETFFWQIIDCCEHGWRVDVDWGHHDGVIPIASAAAETAPLAICRAAILAMEANK